MKDSEASTIYYKSMHLKGIHARNVKRDERFAITIADSCGGSTQTSNKLYKKIEGQWIGKRYVQCRRSDGTTFTAWFDDCDKSLIDARYYNLDGTKK